MYRVYKLNLGPIKLNRMLRNKKKSYINDRAVARYIVRAVLLYIVSLLSYL